MNHREFFEDLAETWGTEEDPFKFGKVLQHINAHRWEKVLDAGTGTGVLLPVLDADEIVALDYSSGMLRKAVENSRDCVYFVQGSTQHLPFASCYFDCVICFRSFPHFLDKNKALSEIYRVLMKDGRLHIAHTTSREVLNSIHRRIGKVVVGDLMPDSPQMKRMLANCGFCEISIINEENLYLASAIRE